MFTGQDLSDLRRLKNEITMLNETAMRGAQALRGLLPKLDEIESRKLYTKEADTMEEFCQRNWRWSDNYVRRVVKAIEFRQAQTMIAETTGESVLVPETEAEARRLMRVPRHNENSAGHKPQENLSCPARLDRSIPAVIVSAPMKSTANLNLRECILDSWNHLKRVVNRPDVPDVLLRELCHVLDTLDRAASLAQLELPGMAERFTIKRFVPPSLEEVQMYCQQEQRQITGADANWFFDHMTGSSWKNNGRPVADWKATMRAWWAQKSIFPSHKQQVISNGRVVTAQKQDSIMTRELDKELERTRRTQ